MQYIFPPLIGFGTPVVVGILKGNFLNDLTSVNGGEYLNEPMNQSLAYNQIKNYEDISKKRFSNIDKTV